jgi:hypothetical protein
VRRVGVIELDHLAQLVVQVISILHLVLRLVRYQREIAGAIVSVLGGRLIVISGLEKPAPRVVPGLRFLSPAIGDEGLVAGVVIGVGCGGGLRRAVAGSDGGQPAGGIVDIVGDILIRIGRCRFAVIIVIGIAGGGGVGLTAWERRLRWFLSGPRRSGA